MSEEAKSRGNAAFSAGDYAAAAEHFTDAIALSPTNHVLYSNRSAAHASLHHYADALEDAKKTVELKPDWSKGYSRLGAAHLGLHQIQEAISAYKKGLEIDPNNEGLKSGLADAQAAAPRSRDAPPLSPFGNAFSGPEMWAKLTADPETRMYLQQPDFVKMMQEMQKNPNNLNLYLKDQRVMRAFGVLLNVKFGGPNSGDDMEIPEETSTPQSSASERKEDKKMEEKVVEPEPMKVTEEAKGTKPQAVKEKELGNAAYKKKEFEKAIEHYTKAMELDDEDISYLTNRAAVYLETGKYDECIKDCDKAVERGRELRSDFKMVARALTRKGTAFVKMAKCSRDYEPAIEAFQKALTEHRNPDTLKRLNEAEKAKKDLEQQEYFDPSLAEEEREKGNEFFKQQKYPEAVKHYSESLRRNPKDPKAYSNRAACYTKLGALPEGLKDAEMCIELDPTFSKGLYKKRCCSILHERNQELLDGVRRCVGQLNKASRGDLSPEELKERQAKGMQDPEIQNILSDPVMRQVLVDFQENPKAAQEHTKNPSVMSKIQKLVQAGIVQMK
ncbi:TPR REPEAT CONTAINING PROTEIN [Salix viminalis]|uniref:TPR REPEAT CONTAINING PROTEIN n=1 Tax=Salix viminalis TaxID=40686 RepID=A0A9Q0T7U8_SALVM|nr:TPR REPEAT CONTAINING PROTEIN [Salix viminalis]